MNVISALGHVYEEGEGEVDGLMGEEGVLGRRRKVRMVFRSETCSEWLNRRSERMRRSKVGGG